MCSGYRPVFLLREEVVELLERVHFTPRLFIPFNLTTAHLRDVSKAFGERAVDERKNPPRSKSPNSCFHHPGPRRCSDVHWTTGKKNFSQTLLKSCEQLLELGARVRYHRPEHCCQHFLPHFGRARKKKRSK